MTRLTADEVTTLDEAWRTGSFVVVLDAVEAMVDAHRDEAVVMDRLTVRTYSTTLPVSDEFIANQAADFPQADR